MSSYFAPLPTTKMTQITGATIISHFQYLFVGRAASDVSSPGQAILLDLSTPHLSFITVTYMDEAPQNFFTWTNSFSVGLFWTSSRKENHALVVYRWDLFTNRLTNTTLKMPGNTCYRWTPAVGVQDHGDYAVLSATKCTGGSDFVLAELHVMDASGKMEFSDTCVDDYDQGAQLALSLREVDPAGCVMAVHDLKTQTGVSLLYLVEFGKLNERM